MSDQLVDDRPLRPAVSELENHPLLWKKITKGFAQWERDWMEEWESELAREFPRASVLIGLLHVGFDGHPGSANTWAERVVFYLQVADGYNSRRLYTRRPARLEGWTDCDDHLEEGRASVSKKALHVLCDKLFVDLIAQHKEELLGEPTIWINLLVSDEAVAELLRFADPGRQLRNLPHHETENRHGKILIEFYKAFIKMLWRDRLFDPHQEEKKEPWAREHIKRGRRARIKSIDIAEAIAAHELLIVPGNFIDPAGDILEYIAMKVLSLRICDGEFPKNLDEAIAAGNKLAQIHRILSVQARKGGWLKGK